MGEKTRSKSKEVLAGLVALIIAAAAWLPLVHFLFTPELGAYRAREGVPPVPRKMAARHLDLWTDSDLREVELHRMQGLNPEWDFMSRTYFVLALANMALRDDAYRERACEIIDAIIDNTVHIEREKGIHHFLLGYGRNDPWEMQPPRSQFIDGEIALMLAARRFVEEKPAYGPLLTERVELMIDRMDRSPVLCAESYPNECWIFCNTVSLAAIRMADVLDGTDHSAFLDAWIDTARRRLTEKSTGMLISAFAVDGTPAPCGFGPEGTSIWMAAHMLQVVDPAFAEDQYRRTKEHLARRFLGFGYSREWPPAVVGAEDVDSGPIIPILEASASASGLALIAAAGFSDDPFLRSLITSLNFAGFPVTEDGRMAYQASNAVGDAVVLYALVEGPLWEAVGRGRP